MKNLLDLFTDEVPDKTPAAAKAERQTTASPVPVSYPPVSQVTAQAMTPENDDIYQKLSGKTSFENTEVGSKIRKYLDSLASLPMDALTKFKTAIAQVKQLDGVADADILATFSQLKQLVKDQIDTFDQKSADFIQREVTAKLDRVQAAQKQIGELQAEITQLTQGATAAQTKAMTLQSQFQAAAQRRMAEIEQQESQTVALLKG